MSRSVFAGRYTAQMNAPLVVFAIGMRINKFRDVRRYPHLASWRDFNRIVGAHPSVGIWHETYTIAPGAYEGIYGNMPVWGMAAATGHVAVGRGREAAKQRLRGGGD